MTKREKLRELEFLLGMVRHRKAAVFPGPGIEEDEKRLLKTITKLKKSMGSK